MTQTSADIELVRKAENMEDVERINSFFNTKSLKRELHRFTYSTTLERAFEREDRRLFYVQEGGDIVGALMVWCESRVLDPDEAQIRLVAVANDYRNQGIGKQLCQQAAKFTREYGMKRISADVASTSPALSFWRACGYEVSYVWETDSGREMSRLEKQL